MKAEEYVYLHIINVFVLKKQNFTTAKQTSLFTMGLIWWWSHPVETNQVYLAQSLSTVYVIILLSSFAFHSFADNLNTCALEYCIQIFTLIILHIKFLSSVSTNINLLLYIISEPLSWKNHINNNPDLPV